MDTPLGLPPIENRPPLAPPSAAQFASLLRNRRQIEKGLPVDLQLIWLNVLSLLLIVAVQESLPVGSFAKSFLAPIRLLLGLIYVLYAPGYCIIAALFPHQNEFGSIERTGLSIGFSIAIVPVLALLLSKSWGLTQWSLLLGEATIIALAIMITLWRQARLPIEQAYFSEAKSPRLAFVLQPDRGDSHPSHPKKAGKEPPWWFYWWTTLSRLEKSIYLLQSAMLSVVLLSAIWIFLIPSPDQFMTEFYILGQNGQPQDYPRLAIQGKELSVTIGIINRERTAHHYRLEAWAVNPWEADKRQLLSQSELGDLPPTLTQQKPFHWSMPWAGDDQKVEFLLFIDNNPEVYRELELWLNVSEE